MVNVGRVGPTYGDAVGRGHAPDAHPGRVGPKSRRPRGADLLLVWSKRLAPDPQERKLWTWIALVALLCLPIVSLATTAVDRVALYLIPIQIFVFSRIPRLAGSNIRVRTLLVLGVIAYYAAVLFVWLNFATHAQYWLPYQFKPFVFASHADAWVPYQFGPFV